MAVTNFLLCRQTVDLVWETAMSQMRCDSCEALRWYGRELHRVTVTEYPGPVTRVYFICEMCQEQRAAALWPEDWEPREPQMHPPHLSRQ